LAEEEPNKNLIELIRAATGEGVASGTGSLIGGAVGGIPGAIIGGAAGSVSKDIFDRLGDEFNQRFLSHREKVRVGKTFLGIIQRVEDAQKEGEDPRDDGFFEPGAGERSDGEEVLEGIIQAAKDEYEERKLPYLMNLGRAAFMKSALSRNIAVQLVHLAEMLSYQELILLGIIAINENKSLGLREKVYSGEKKRFSDQSLIVSVLQDFNHLKNLGLITDGDPPGYGPAEFIPAQMALVGGPGKRLVVHMRLAEMPESERAPYVALLKE